MCESTEQPVNRLRRAVYVFTVTAFGLASAFYLSTFGSGVLAESYVKAAFELVGWLGAFYIGAGVADRANIGAIFAARQAPPPPPRQEVGT